MARRPDDDPEAGKTGPRAKLEHVGYTVGPEELLEDGVLILI